VPDTDHQDEPRDAPRSEAPVLNTLDRLELWDREGLAPASFAVLLVIAAAGLLYTLAPFAQDIILAFVVVGLFGPLYERLLPKVRSPWVCSGMVTALAILVVAAPISWLTLTLFEEATAAYSLARPSLEDGSAPRQLRRFLAQIGISVSEEQLVALIASYAERISDFAIAQASKLLNNLIAALVHFCIVVVLVFYTLVEGTKLKEFLFRLSPLPDDQDELIVLKFTTVARSVLVGNVIGSVLQGVAGGIAMALVGLSSPVLWGTVMSIAAFLPLFGVSVVVIPAGTYLILQGRTAEAVAFMAVSLSVAMVMENVLKTKLMGAGVRVHEVLLFLGILGGLAGFGIIGLLYGPLIVAIFLTLTELYMTHYRPQFAARFARRKRSRGSFY
jgi:predicted PurR-regulated permease PerM